MSTFCIDVFGSQVSVYLSKGGSGFIDNSDYNDKLPVVEFKIVNPGNLLTSCYEVDQGFKEALKNWYKERESAWAMLPATANLISQLEEWEKRIEDARRATNELIDQYNETFHELRNSAKEAGVRGLTTGRYDDEHYDPDHECIEIYDGDRGIDIEILLKNFL